MDDSRTLAAAEVERHWREAYPILVGFALRRFRLPEAEAENLAQELFLALLENRRPVRNVRRWLVGAMANSCRAWWRKQRGDEGGGELDELERTPGSVLADRIHRDLLLREVGARLEPRDAEVLARHYLEGETVSELASALGLSPGSAVQLIHRCLARAKKAYALLQESQ